MQPDDQIRLWNQASAKVMDVRHAFMKRGEAVRSYLLPANAFFYAVNGSARIWLDRSEHGVQSYHVFHAAKGQRLDIAVEDSFEYYTILYKATLPFPNRRDAELSAAGHNPLQHVYAFEPPHPLSLLHTVEQMSKQWHRPDALEKLHVKSLFYQFVYELLRQWQEAEGEQGKQGKIDFVAQAIRYMQDRYGEPISLESLARDLECSVGHLSKLFKARMNTSPIQYLGEVRMNQAAEWLLRTDATLQEIAQRVGYPDGHSLSRSFKRYKGMSPARFRAYRQRGRQDEDLPRYRRRSAILPGRAGRYIGNDIENHYQYKEEVNVSMYRSAKMTAMTILMCLSLLLGACSGATNTSGGSQAPSASTTSEAQSSVGPSHGEETSTAAKTRIVSTLRGDVEVPVEPQRVASDQYMGQLLKLGIVPVGVRDGMLTEGWIEKAGIRQETLSGIESLGGFPMNAEKLISLNPDLIIGSIEKNIEQYEKIGTTVFLPYWEGLSTAGPLEKFRRISEIFGKEEIVDAWIAEYKQKVEQAREQIAGIIKDGETVSVVQIGTKALYVLAAKGGNYGSSTIYEMLQLPPTVKAKEMTDGFANVSLEVLQDYLGDHVFVYVNDKTDAEEVMNSALWKGAPAVKNGHVYMYGEFGDEFVMEDPYSLELQLDTIVRILLESRNK